jgi:putative protein-disulfide isomerase
MKLIYIMDPLCGWCYGNSETTHQLFEKYKDTFDFEILPAGMWTGQNARKQSKQMSDYFRKHDLHIQEHTGTAFGDAYFKLIEDENIVLDSEIPSRAIVTVNQNWKEKSVLFAAEVQKARYFYGNDLNDKATYLAICKALNIDSTPFLLHFNSAEMKTETQKTFASAQKKANSYPTLLLENNGALFVLEQGFAPFDEIVHRIQTLKN